MRIHYRLFATLATILLAKTGSTKDQPNARQDMLFPEAHDLPGA